MFGNDCGAPQSIRRRPPSILSSGGFWGNQFLLPVLSTDPDAIRFTSYEELRLGAHEQISAKRAIAEEDKP